MVRKQWTISGLMGGPIRVQAARTKITVVRCHGQQPEALTFFSVLA